MTQFFDKVQVFNTLFDISHYLWVAGQTQIQILNEFPALNCELGRLDFDAVSQIFALKLYSGEYGYYARYYFQDFQLIATRNIVDTMEEEDRDDPFLPLPV